MNKTRDYTTLFFFQKKKKCKESFTKETWLW